VRVAGVVAEAGDTDSQGPPEAVAVVVLKERLPEVAVMLEVVVTFVVVPAFAFKVTLFGLGTSDAAMAAAAPSRNAIIRRNGYPIKPHLFNSSLCRVPSDSIL
jgi:hypothetical protein